MYNGYLPAGTSDQQLTDDRQNSGQHVQLMMMMTMMDYLV